MKKIVIAGMMMDTNLGDDIYPHCLKYLFSEISDAEMTFCEMDFCGRAIRSELNTATEKKAELINSKNLNILQKLTIKCVNGVLYRLDQKDRAQHIVWKVNPNNQKRLYEYYTKCLEGADLLVFGGGGIIEFSGVHDAHHHVGTILEIADEMHIPTVFNSVGRVVNEKHMFGFDIMKKALNRDCVKSMTCRDGVDWVNQNIYDGKPFATELPCCAVFSSEAYHVTKDPASRTIGIGVIRENIFASYGNSFSPERLLDLYEQVVRKVLELGYDCCIFTNGYSKDIEFGQKLSERLGKSTHICYALCPSNGEELVRTIATFKAMITARLHSIIVAYALDVPAVGITWTNKVADFLNLAGKPENAVPAEKLKADVLVNALQKAIKEGYDSDLRDSLKEKIHGKVKEMLTYMK